MNTKSLLALLAGFATLMLSGFLFYEYLLKSYFASFMEEMGECVLQQPPILPIIVAHLCFSIILLLVLRRDNVTSFLGGIQSCWYIVVLIMIWYDSWNFTIFPQFKFTMAIIDVSVNSICGILAAGAIGWVLGRFK